MKIPAMLLSVGLASTAWSATIYVNQAAFNSAYPKQAVVQSSNDLSGAAFTLKSSGAIVHTGVLSAKQTVTDWGTSYYVADFSAITVAGTYTVEVSDNGALATSYPFVIGANALADATLPKLMNYFQADRAVTSKNGKNVLGADASIYKYGTYTTSYDVHGGWFDAAGDLSKYLSHLSYANYLNPQQTPLTVWAMAYVNDRIPTLLSNMSLATSVKSQATWGADFLLRMLDPVGYFYITVFDGWTGNLSQRQICAFTGTDGIRSAAYQAAFREGGGMSIAALARVSTMGINGDFTSAAYLAGAERAYAHLKGKTVNGVCEYCDDKKENIIDDYTALLAASELYKATSNATYIEDARVRAEALIGRLSTEGYFYSDDARTRPFWHASDAGLPLVALTRYLEVEPATNTLAIQTGMKTHLDYLVRVTNSVTNPFGYARQVVKPDGGTIRTGFFIPQVNESGYWYQGENARLGSLAAAALYTGRMMYPMPSATASVPDSILRFAIHQLDWVLGGNPKGISFFQGLGQVNSPGYFNADTTAGQLVGGIANGITSMNADGTGFVFNTKSNFGEKPWLAWRWEEQWIPHSTWFLMAIAAMNDEKPQVPAGIHTTPHVTLNENQWSLQKSGAQAILHFKHQTREDLPLHIVDLKGHELMRQIIPQGTSDISLMLPSTQKGILLLRVGSQTKRITSGVER